MTQVTLRPFVRVPLPKGGHIDFKPWGKMAKAAGEGAAFDAFQGGHGRALAEIAYTIGAARWGAVAWEGVGDEGGQPLELSPEALEALLDSDDGAYLAVDERYVLKGLAEDQEKNGSAPSRDGTSRESGTPKSPRGRRSAAGATAQSATRGRAKPAPTS